MESSELGGRRYGQTKGMSVGSEKWVDSRELKKENHSEVSRRTEEKLYWISATTPAMGWESEAPERLGNTNKRYKSSTREKNTSSHLPLPPPHLLGRMNPISNKMLKVRAISTSFNRFFGAGKHGNGIPRAPL